MIHDIVEKDNSTNKECYEIECRQHMIGVKKVIIISGDIVLFFKL